MDKFNQSIPSLLASQSTPLHQCSYLPDRAARLEFIELKDAHSMGMALFSQFSRLGFRRSGQHLYRPLCLHCQRCITTRVPVQDFMPSRSQRRVLQRGQGIHSHVIGCDELSEVHYQLYARYICARHSDGDMYPPSYASFQRFLQFSFTDSFCIEFWQDQKLVMVAVCDALDDGLSAVYTFYDPALPRLSLGTLSILRQIDYVKQQGLDYLYLGYWVPDSEKMQYKTNFYPIELLINQTWHYFDHQVSRTDVEPYLQAALKQRYRDSWQR